MLRLATLDSVLRDIRSEMQRTWRRQLQLPDNLPLLVEYRANHLPADRRTKIENKVGFEKTGWFDTHPSAADRVRQARLLAEPGLLEGDDVPARDLFDNFDNLSRLVTLAHYEDDLNVPTSPDFLIPLEAVIDGSMRPKPQSPVAPVPMMAYDPNAFRTPGQDT
jgi:hypothetical protein